jgi:REP element-mobilizing transposase RayT
MANPGVASLDPFRFPQRKSVRLEDHSYSAGAYFITICVRGRRPLLGTIVEDEALLSAAGNIVAQEWLRTPQLRPEVLTDAFVVMPDHFHAVVILLDPLPILPSDLATVSPVHVIPPQWPAGSWAHAVRPHGSRAGASDPPVGSRAHAVRPYLGRILAGFKSSCTRRYLASIPEASGALWQRGYYEHVVRGAAELDRIRTYIADNPRRWGVLPGSGALPTNRAS